MPVTPAPDAYECVPSGSDRNRKKPDYRNTRPGFAHKMIAPLYKYLRDFYHQGIILWIHSLPGSVGMAGKKVTVRGKPVTRTALVVDDQPMMIRLCRSILQGMEYDVLEAHSGEEAWAILEKKGERIGLLLTDIKMGPGMDGVELASRARDVYRGIDIVVMSGFAEEATVKRLIARSEFRFLHKPFTISELRDAIREPKAI
jgi:CheY-like chemotaxis protein